MMKSGSRWAWVASLGGVGYFPKVPGTMGSFVTLPVLWGVSHWGVGVYSLVSLILLPIAIVAAERAGQASQVADDQRIVIDESMGMAVACWGLAPQQWGLFAAAFGLFRLFDIVKPWPASYFDRQKHGFGVVMDDVVAGVYAAVGIGLLRFVI